MLRVLSAALAAFVLAGCGDVMGDQRIAGSYYLVAIDETENMRVCFSDEAFCIGDQLPDATVFAAGGDDRYVVAARHPRIAPRAPVDKGVTEYYYIVRRWTRDGRVEMHGETVGPFDQATFEREKQRLNLPDFAITIERLR